MNDLAEFVKRLHAKLVRRGETVSDAEDLVQEAFLRYQEAGAGSGVRHPKAYLSRIAVNLAVDTGRRRARSPVIPLSPADHDVIDFLPGPCEVLEARERLRRLMEGLSRLSPRSRRILLAKRLEGFTHAEIAEREGITVGATEKQMVRSMLFLIDWMKE